MKKTLKMINGQLIKMTDSQLKELERDGMVIVGERIIRTAAYIKRTECAASQLISNQAKKLFNP